MILRKCAPGKEEQIRVIFEKQPFGELERTQAPLFEETGRSNSRLYGCDHSCDSSVIWSRTRTCRAIASRIPRAAASQV
jgi:hypothetical protein